MSRIHFSKRHYICRQGAGISSEIETSRSLPTAIDVLNVARGLASHLRLKQPVA